MIVVVDAVAGANEMGHYVHTSTLSAKHVFDRTNLSTIRDNRML
jgi:hypothetical protein